MMPADYMQFVTPVLLVGIFMWMWREHRDLRSYIDSRFDKNNERFEGVDSKFDKVNERFENLQSNMDSKFEKVNERFENLQSNVDSKFEKVNERFENLQSNVDSKFEKVNERFDGLQSDMNAEFRASNKSLNELTMRVGRLEGAAMHAFGSTLFGEELADSEGSRRQFEVRYDAPEKNDEESA